MRMPDSGHTAEVDPAQPLAIIDDRDAGDITTEEMMRRLRAIDYTEGQIPTVGDGVLTDAYVRGSWDNIEFAYQQDRLTDSQFDSLFRTHQSRREAKGWPRKDDQTG